MQKELIDTPAGSVNVWSYEDRQEFENAIIEIAYKGQTKPIPKSMGALSLFGKNGFALILLSNGPYSAVPAESLGLDEKAWIEKSYKIRKYHELTHFVSRKLFFDNKEAIRDEVVADMIGLIFAFGEYNKTYAKIFLGTEGKSYRMGGRLQNYVTEDKSLEEVMSYANNFVDKYYEESENFDLSKPFDFLIKIEEEYKKEDKLS